MSNQETNEGLVRLRLITHNARLVDARKERDITQPVMAGAVGIRQSRLRDIENLRVVPTDNEIAELACALEKPTDYLFPEELLEAIQAGVFGRRKIELPAVQVISLTEAQELRMLPSGNTTFEDIENEATDRSLLTERIEEVLATLKPKEQLILKFRFGLDGDGAKTLEEVGKKFGLSRSRINQIEAHALRHLRHLTRSRRLQDFL